MEESEEINAKSVKEIAEKYKNETFCEYKVEYLHGKMNKKEKESIMEKAIDNQMTWESIVRRIEDLV